MATVLTPNTESAINSANTNRTRVEALSTTEAVTVYRPSTWASIYARKITASGSTVSAGSQHTVQTGSNITMVFSRVPGTDKFLVPYTIGSPSYDSYAMILDATGGSFSNGAALTLDTASLNQNPAGVGLSSSLCLASYHKGSSPWVHTVHRLTLSGTTLTSTHTGTLFSAGTSPGDAKFDRIDDTTGIAIYEDGGSTIYGKTIDAASALTINSAQTLTTFSGNTTYDVAMLSSTAGIIVYGSSTDGKLYARHISVSGSTITAGSEVEVATSYTASDVKITKLSATRALVHLEDGTPNLKLVALSVSGTTVTVDGSQATLYAGNSAAYGHCNLSETLTISTYCKTDGDTYLYSRSVTIGETDTYKKQARGAHQVLQGYTAQARGLHRVTYEKRTNQGRGAANVFQAFRNQGRGLYRITYTPRRNQGRGTFHLSYGTRRNQARGVHRVARDLDTFRLYESVDGAAFDFSTILDSNDTGIFNLTPTAGHLYRYIVRRVNQYGLESQNTDYVEIELDGAGDQEETKPSPAEEVQATATAGGVVEVTALYYPTPDGDNAATDFLVYWTDDGTDPDPLTDTPAVVPVTAPGGVAFLSWDSGVYATGTTIKAIVSTRRGTTESTQSAIVSAVTDATAPATPDGISIQGAGAQYDA